MTFDEVYTFTNGISNEAAFRRDESELLYTHLMALEEGSRVLEIGCQYGRSTSIFAAVAQQKNFDLWLNDDFSHPPEALPECMKMLLHFDIRFTLLKMQSTEALPRLQDKYFDLVLIDGWHDYDTVYHDCQIWDQMNPDGIVAFHDYGRDSLPDVYRAVNDYREKVLKVKTKTTKTKNKGHHGTGELIAHVYTLALFH